MGRSFQVWVWDGSIEYGVEYGQVVKNGGVIDYSSGTVLAYIVILNSYRYG